MLDLNLPDVAGLHGLTRLRTTAPGEAFVTAIRTASDGRIYLPPGFTPLSKGAPADAERSAIHGMPAGPEYARILGKDPQRLLPFFFTANPVVS